MQQEKHTFPYKPKLKFMQALDAKQMEKMEEQAKIRGISVQEMIRAVVIPEWLRHQK